MEYYQINGWKNYEKFTSNNNEFHKMSKEKITDPDDYHTRMEKEREKCKYQAFGKIKYRPGRDNTKRLNKLIDEKMNMIVRYSNNENNLEEKIVEIDQKIITAVNDDQTQEREKEFPKNAEYNKRKRIMYSYL